MNNYCGRHLFVDMYGCKIDISFENKGIMEKLKDIINDTGATIIHTHSHNFEGGGLSGLFILSESHFSIHTWPEYKYVSIDVYMCGECDPEKTYRPLIEYFKPTYDENDLFQRGDKQLFKKHK